MELIDNLRDYITKLNDKHLDITKENLSLKDEIEKLHDRLENISNVSIIKNLNTQIYEKDQVIYQLEKKLSSIITKNNDLSSKLDTLLKEPIKLTIKEPEVEEVPEDQVEEVPEDQVEEVPEDQVEEVPEDQVEEVPEDQVPEDQVEEDQVEDDQVPEDQVPEDQVEEDQVPEDQVPEDQVEEDQVEEEEEVIEEEISFIEKKLKPPNSTSRKLKTYLITDDEYKDIYERLEDGEPGEHVGKLTGKQNKPFFFT